jgi:hypothetical protein
MMKAAGTSETSADVHGIRSAASQKTAIFIVVAVRTRDFSELFAVPLPVFFFFQAVSV